MRLKKRQLPCCAPLPNISFDIDIMREWVASHQNDYVDVYSANPGIHKVHNSEFVKELYDNQNFEEIPLMGMAEEDMQVAESFDESSLGETKLQRIRAKRDQVDGLPAVANEYKWDVPNDLWKGSYFEEAFYRQFSAPVCRARIHRLTVGKTIVPHIDYDPSYAVRIIVPIQGTDGVTNAFWPNNVREDYNLKADGSAYFLNTGFKHAVYHEGNEDRIAFVFSLKSQEDIYCLKL
jgi:hypothetical protein